MKLETYLNAMVTATVHAIDLGEYADSELYEKRQRQYFAFRDRILRMFEEKDDVIKHLRIALIDCDEELEKLEGLKDEA